MQQLSSSSVSVRFLDGPKVIEALRKRAEKLVADDPRVESVILFGSLAKGNYTPRSDADICVILHDDDPRRPMDRIPEFLDYFLRAPVPVDVLVYTQAEVERMRREGRRFVREALEEGVILAERRL